MESKDFINKIVEVIIDRPIGSKHPEYDSIYPLNYGYIPNTVSGDGEELDCFILGINEKMEKYTGKCIAVIHRLDDNEDKLVIAPEGKEYTTSDIRALTDFQEQYFKSDKEALTALEEAVGPNGRPLFDVSDSKSIISNELRFCSTI